MQSFEEKFASEDEYDEAMEILMTTDWSQGLKELKEQG